MIIVMMRMMFQRLSVAVHGSNSVFVEFWFCCFLLTLESGL